MALEKGTETGIRQGMSINQYNQNLNLNHLCCNSLRDKLGFGFRLDHSEVGYLQSTHLPR